MKLTNLRIGVRLGAAFAVMVLMSLLMASVALYELRVIEKNLEDLVLDNNVKIKLNNDMSESVHIVSRVSRTLVLLNDASAMAAEKAKIDRAREAYNKAWFELQKFPASETGKTNRARISEAAQKARPLNSQVIDFALAGKDAEVTALLLQQAGPATQQWQDAIHENLKFKEGNNTKQYEHSVDA